MLRFVLGLLALLTTLSACGTDRNPLLSRDVLGGLIPGQRKAPPDLDPVAIAGLVQSNLAALKEPAMLAILEDRKAAAVVVPYGRNGPVTTWTTQDFTTLSFRGGLLTATRGLGTDLMSASTSSTRVALLAGGGQSTQTWRTLDSTNATIDVEMSCRITGGASESVALASGATRTARKFDALCTGDGYDVRNTYWLAPDGTVVQSRQWVGPGAGYLTQQLLRS